MQLLAAKAIVGLRRLSLFAAVLLMSAIVFWRYTIWWCFWMGPETTVTIPIRPKHVYQENIQVGQIESNCGVREICAEGSFPVYLSTGQPDDLWPQLCVSGKYIFQRSLNGGGRGLNAVLLEPHQFQVVSVRNFDTYSRDSSTDLDAWLDQILDNDIIILFTSDEASSKLNHSTKVLLNALGSGKVQDLSYRAQWFLITQKGTKGFSVYEKVTYPRNKSWGERIEFRGCVPRVVPKHPISIDPPPRDLTARDRFCLGKTDPIYQAICTESRFELMAPALLTNRSLIGNMVYSTPIYLFAGSDFEVLLAALHSLIHQPGILLSSLTLVYNSTVKDIADLASLFNLRSIGVAEEIKSWSEMQVFARQDTLQQHPAQKFLIVIEPDTIPSPDFLFFFAQTAPTLLKDNTLSAVSAWSPNCYSSPGDVHLAYRVHDVPKYTALFRVEDIEGDIIAPDVSRVQGPEACHPPSLKSGNWIERPQDLTQERYFHKLVILQQRSEAVNVSHILKSCSALPFNENSSYVLYFKDDGDILYRILGCLGIIRSQVGHYQKIIRLTVSKASVVLINSNSSFYKARPIHS